MQERFLKMKYAFSNCSKVLLFLFLFFILAHYIFTTNFECICVFIILFSDVQSFRAILPLFELNLFHFKCLTKSTCFADIMRTYYVHLLTIDEAI